MIVSMSGETCRPCHCRSSADVADCGDLRGVADGADDAVEEACCAHPTTEHDDPHQQPPSHRGASTLARRGARSRRPLSRFWSSDGGALGGRALNPFGGHRDAALGDVLAARGLLVELGDGSEAAIDRDQLAGAVVDRGRGDRRARRTRRRVPSRRRRRGARSPARAAPRRGARSPALAGACRRRSSSW